jgi:uncharacterized RDD family membrane protein YckC
MRIIADASKARLIAAFIDHLIAFALMLLVVALVPEELPTLKAILFFLVYLAYFIVLESLWSRTLGKFFQGLVIRKLDGRPCDLTAALIRSGLRILEVNPLLFWRAACRNCDPGQRAKAANRRCDSRNLSCVG